MRPRLASALAAALCGCPEKADDTAIPDPFAPTEGHWSYDSQEVLEDSCGSHGEPQGGGFTLTVTGEGRFELVTDEFYGTFPCTLEGMDFACDPRRAWEQDLSGEGLDAVVYNEASAEGTFQDRDSLEGTHTGHLGCEGADCEAAWAMMDVQPPCDVMVAFTMSADVR